MEGFLNAERGNRMNRSFNKHAVKLTKDKFSFGKTTPTDKTYAIADIKEIKRLDKTSFQITMQGGKEVKKFGSDDEPTCQTWFDELKKLHSAIPQPSSLVTTPSFLQTQPSLLNLNVGATTLGTSPERRNSLQPAPSPRGVLPTSTTPSTFASIANITNISNITNMTTAAVTSLPGLVGDTLGRGVDVVTNATTNVVNTTTNLVSTTSNLVSTIVTETIGKVLGGDANSETDTMTDNMSMFSLAVKPKQEKKASGKDKKNDPFLRFDAISKEQFGNVDAEEQDIGWTADIGEAFNLKEPIPFEGSTQEYKKLLQRIKTSEDNKAQSKQAGSTQLKFPVMDDVKKMLQRQAIKTLLRKESMLFKTNIIFF